ncbi:sialate O-acetylesterase [Croceibacterium selenioxidans]|uniref:sialate O-acetylesterase n=1 Tax=Croceibacterium selenioxidans TaxID=2838833 RepID=UPI00308448EE
MRRAALLIAGVVLPTAAQAAPQLLPIWQDHAVIQRDRPVVVEGTAQPGERVSATLGMDSASATAAADGSFALTLPARPANAMPQTLSVTDSSGTATINDILVGDVWLCSGQSNMAFTVSAGLNGYNNIQVSADPLLRMLTVPQETSAKPVREFGGEVSWQAASPQTTGAFSAACYYMLRDLRAALDIPMGAVHSSWGGSQIRAWLTPEAGKVLYGADQMALLDTFGKDPLAAVTEFAPKWEAWWRERTGQEPWKDPSVVQWQPVPSISPWGNWSGTRLAKDGLGNVLLRQTVTLTAEQAKAGGVLNIGIIDDLDATWVNGKPVGITHGWGAEREYRIPPGYLKAGANEILVIASNSWAAGGFTSAADRLSFTVTGGERIPLGEGWQFSIAGHTDMPPRSPWDANAGIGVMHNRMIAPIGHYAMTGATWYQGESDVGIAGYRDRLRELFAGWRRQFGADTRVLVVQLANYGPTASAPVDSGWASLREDERQAVLADKNAALVTAIDLGDRTDIHPGNKVELGKRLALEAQGKALPGPQRAVLEGTDVRVSFTGLEGGLQSWSGPPLAFELCGPTQESCRYASAAIAGDAIVLRGDGQPVTRVRYAWADSPVVNLYDARPAPLPGFELPVER